MTASTPKDNWADGDAYDSYIGRWSRIVAREFVTWLAVPPGQRWLDVGCGTGALTQTILDLANPEAVKGIDPSAYLQVARNRITDPRAEFAAGAAQSIPGPDASHDAAVCGLVLNFVPEPVDAVREMSRVVSEGGTVASYVWDYSGGMQILRKFWDTAVTLDPKAAVLDEGTRFLCNPDALTDVFAAANLRTIETRAIDIPTPFADFDEYWSPFLRGQGPAGSYVVTRSPEDRDRLREAIRDSLPIEADGSINLIARAWAIRGTR